MNFSFYNLIPLPMTELPKGNSEVWEADSYIFEQGKSYLVEASSGKGKTSLLSVMYGLRKDYSGDLKIDDNNARQFKSSDWSKLRKSKVSYIFQGLQLFEDLSALDNILLKNKISNHKTEEEIIDMAARLGVDIFLKKKIRHMSFGQQQRIAIIRALCQPFNFLFADECFSHIDKDNGSYAIKLIKEECQKQNAGLILTSLGNISYEFDVKVKL